MTLTPTSQRLTDQLTHLQTVERPRLLELIATVDGRDSADQAERAAREVDLATVDARIARLTARIAAGAGAGSGDADTGAQAGAAVVLDFGDGPETYRLADHVDGGLDVITPDSPLGRALTGAAAGQQVTYATPRGQRTVTVVDVTA